MSFIIEKWIRKFKLKWILFFFVVLIRCTYELRNKIWFKSKILHERSFNRILIKIVKIVLIWILSFSFECEVFRNITGIWKLHIWKLILLLIEVTRKVQAIIVYIFHWAIWIINWCKLIIVSLRFIISLISRNYLNIFLSLILIW